MRHWWNPADLVKSIVTSIQANEGQDGFPHFSRFQAIIDADVSWFVANEERRHRVRRLIHTKCRAIQDSAVRLCLYRITP